MSEHRFLVGAKYWLKGVWGWYRAQWYGRWYQRLVTPLYTFLLLFFLYLGAVNCNLLWLFGKSPSMSALENPITHEASLIYSADSVLIGKFFDENRSPVKFEEISPYVIDALISTEDERFYKHHGIDVEGLFAAAKDIARGNARGASTITQQLVKNLFRMRSQYSTGILGHVPVLRLLIMKSKEWISAIKIENLYTKKDILTLYLNTVDFGSNAFGIKTAAKTYFNTTPDQLTPEQSATLVGLLKATTTYNPKVNPKNSLARRNIVLSNMYEHGNITKTECDSLQQIPIDLSYNVENAYDGQANYFREAIRKQLHAWTEEHQIDLDADGLKIYTTLDTRLQRYAEESVLKQMNVVQKRFDEHWRGQNPWRDERGQEIPNFIEDIARRSSYYEILSKRYNQNEDSIWKYMNEPHPVKIFSYSSPSRTIEKEMSTMDSIRSMVRFMHAGFVVIEPQTSYVRAWVGDIDFSAWKYDKVMAMRQPGSTFKLFVYASAFENTGLTPTTRREDSFISLHVKDNKGEDKIWTPHNANGYCTGANMPLKSAFAQSVNTIAVKLGQETGIENVIDIAHKMGIHSPLKATPSLALGASDVTLLEMADAYACAMNDGMQRDPILVERILDRDGNIIYDAEKDVLSASRAISYQTAFYLQRLLWGGMHEPGGTSQALWEYVHCYDTELGGKTGTSSNHSDAWFVGCSPNLVGASWVGGEYRSIHFRTGKLGQGSRTALPIFGYFMEKVLADRHFPQYHGKFPDAKENIPHDTYIGESYYAPRREESDSVESSMNTESEDVKESSSDQSEFIENL